MAFTVQPETKGTRLVGLVRHVTLGGLAGAIAGLVVLGVGGRFVMFLSRLLHPEALGRVTEAGNRIGEFTIEGTIGFLFFGGLGSGLLGGVVWVLVREWIPKKAALVGIGAVAIGGGFLIEADNIDFVILQDPRIDLVMLLGLLFLFGVAVYWLDGLLNEKMPDQPRTFGIVVYSLMTAMAAPLVIPTFGNFLSQEFCFCSNPPIWIGVLLIASSLATVIWWVQRLRGADKPSQGIKAFGTTAVALTAAAGAVYLVIDLTHIL